MRLLVADEEIIAGGVETLRGELLPELARLCESVIWALPEHVCGQFRERMRSVPNLAVKSLRPARLHPGRLARAVLRRIPTRWSQGAVQRMDERQVQARLRSLVRQHGCTHSLTTCVFTQRFPVLRIPLAGFVCDVNPALPPATLRNILDWAGRADAIFAISDFTQAELCRLAPASAPRIQSVPLAATVARLAGAAQCEPFDFYFPAAPNPHKGHATLLAACALLVERGRDFRLVLSGPGIAGWAGLAEARRTLGARLEVRSDVPPAEVEGLFAAARCIVLPTSYEGFGLPLAEALRRGKEVICTDIAPFREQLQRYACADRARLVPVGDAGRLAEALEQHLSAPLPPLPEAECRQRLARWTWADAARRCHTLLTQLGP